MSEPIAEARNLVVRFRQGLRKPPVRALDFLTLAIPEGAIFGLLGPNGAGKSTAMYSFLGLLKPNEGSVRVMGREPELGADFFDEVGYLPEEPHYHPYLTVGEAVTYYANLYRRKIPKSTIDECIERVGLDRQRNMRIAHCSKGMKQKVGIAVCMLFTPRLLFLDEPTRGLDPMMTHMLRDYLVEANRKGCTIILNSHVLAEVETVCTRVAIMHKGSVIVEDELQALLRGGDHAYAVSIDGMVENPPGFMQETTSLEGTTHAIIRKEDLVEFFRFLEAQGLELDYCRRQKETLEEVFLRIINKEAQP